MKVDVQFVHFPKSHAVRNIIAERIVDCIDKFSTNVTSVRAFFSADGLDTHVKIAVNAGHLNACVNASAHDLAHSIEKVLGKLESLLRKISAKKKHIKREFSAVNAYSAYNVTNLRTWKRSKGEIENVFDKFEKDYTSDFENDSIRRAS